MSAVTQAAVTRIDKGPVAWLSLNRAEAMNALDERMLDDLAAHLSDIEDERDVRVVVVTATGRAFCAGADLKEVLGSDGRWIAAPPIAGTYVVNLGDMMQRWTNDRYRSNLHRVQSPVGRDGQAGERYSIAYFFDIDYHARVSALPGCFDADDPPHYPPISAGAHIAEMYRRTTVEPA